MLTVTRKPGEDVVIATSRSELIRVGVTSLRGDRVRISIDAPAQFAILRSEHLDGKDDDAVDRLIADCSRRSIAKRAADVAASILIMIATVATFGAIGGIVAEAGKNMGVIE